MAAKKTAVFPGSFDPPTLGHLDLFERAATLFDRLVVGVLENPSKSAALLKSPARCELIAAELELRGVSSVEVQVFEGLAVDFAGSVGASWIVRGLRSAADLGSESAMAACMFPPASISAPSAAMKSLSASWRKLSSYVGR